MVSEMLKKQPRRDVRDERELPVGRPGRHRPVQAESGEHPAVRAPCQSAILSHGAAGDEHQSRRCPRRMAAINVDTVAKA